MRWDVADLETLLAEARRSADTDQVSSGHYLRALCYRLEAVRETLLRLERLGRRDSERGHQSETDATLSNQGTGIIVACVVALESLETGSVCRDAVPDALKIMDGGHG